MKYIDAEKLKQLIDEKYREFRLKGFKEDPTYYYYADGLDLVEQLIDSLHQEQSKVNLENELKEDWLFADKTEVDCIECMCLTEDTFVSLAKKYFELGINARKEE